MTLALIAGQGGLPRAVVAGLARREWKAFHLNGFEAEVETSGAFRIEQLGSFIAGLREAGVDEVCLAGAIGRPKLEPSLIDAQTMPLVPRMMQALQAGDDAALRIVLEIFEESGIRVVSAQEVVPGLLAIPAVGTPDKQDLQDIEKAAFIHDAMADLDIGQGCVVARGQVLAVEAAPGTDWMLASLNAHFVRPSGGVFYKMYKKNQDLRVDMPTIGPDTVTAVARAGLNGIAVRQDGVLVLEADEMRARLEETGLFLTALPK